MAPKRKRQNPRKKQIQVVTSPDEMDVTVTNVNRMGAQEKGKEIISEYEKVRHEGIEKISNIYFGYLKKSQDLLDEYNSSELALLDQLKVTDLEITNAFKQLELAFSDEGERIIQMAKRHMT